MDKNKKFIIIFIIVFISCFLYLGAKSTYTAYKQEITGEVSNKIANFKLLINGQDARNSKILINDVITNSTHTRAGKLAPGTCGYFNINLDPSQSEVALLYKFEFIDRNVNKDKLIEFQQIKSDNSNIVKTGPQEYSGIITLADIKSSLKPLIRIDFCYPDEGEQEPISEDNLNLDDFFEIDFYTYQYLGEELIEYKNN